MEFCSPQTPKTRRMSGNLDNYLDLRSHEFFEESVKSYGVELTNS